MADLILDWTSDVDPGPPPSDRTQLSVLVPPGFTHLHGTYTTNGWSGAARIFGEPLPWFNEYVGVVSDRAWTDPQTTYVTVGGDRVYVQVNNGASGGWIELKVYGDAVSPSSYCGHGTRLKSGVPSIVALAPSTILTIAGLFTKGFKTTLATFFAGRLVDTADLCGQLPPPVPTIEPIDIVNLTTYIAFGDHQDAYDKFWTWILAMVWPVFCECVPGSPTPVTPPPPDPTGPPDLPVFGPSPCDNSDICALLMATKEEVDGLYGLLAMIRQEIQALQSQSVPFGYVPGTLHTGLTGQGEFAVSGILGLSVEFTTVPSYLGQREDDPLTTYGLGEIGLGTADGWLRSVKCSHNPHLVLPIGGEITRVAYTLAGGAVANILELVRRVS